MTPSLSGRDVLKFAGAQINIETNRLTVFFSKESESNRDEGLKAVPWKISHRTSFSDASKSPTVMVAFPHGGTI
jgi:hypothetical protein